MAGTETYHEYQQPYRIQKRLVLNQCFKCIQADDQLTKTINYVTFGGEDLYDLMDFVGVFDIRHHNLNVVSYEEHEDIARKSCISAVAITLSKVSTISIEIVPTLFFENARRLRTLRPSGPFIYFLDDTKTFGDRQANTLLDLLTAGLLYDRDWLLITSCLTPRVVRQPRFMNRYDSTFKLFYGIKTIIDVEFRVRNHVDLLVALTFSRYQQIKIGTFGQLRATLLRKFKYRDTRADMGLWLYRIESVDLNSSGLVDQQFEEFPHAFEKIPQMIEEIPNIFE
jgi:hypothetical protein